MIGGIEWNGEEDEDDDDDDIDDGFDDIDGFNGVIYTPSLAPTQILLYPFSFPLFVGVIDGLFVLEDGVVDNDDFDDVDDGFGSLEGLVDGNPSSSLLLILIYLYLLFLLFNLFDNKREVLVVVVVVGVFGDFVGDIVGDLEWFGLIGDGAIASSIPSPLFLLFILFIDILDEGMGGEIGVVVVDDNDDELEDIGEDLE